MQFSTPIDNPSLSVQITPRDVLLFVGSCFAESVSRRLEADCFRVIANPFGVMYNPVSVFHTIERLLHSDAHQIPSRPSVVFLTFGTNHVYRLKSSGEIVDNCQKRPHNLFVEEQLSVEMCADVMADTIALLREWNPDMRIVMTVSPIRYQKYGFHDSQLSKATLLLSVDKVVKSNSAHVEYFPAYEIMNDELRDYRYYATDMIHPSEQAVDYIYENLLRSVLSPDAVSFVEEWQPLKRALSHRPFDADSEAYRMFIGQTLDKVRQFAKKYDLDYNKLTNNKP